MRFVIVANGVIHSPQLDRGHLAAGDVIIAADGGLFNCHKLNIQPDLLIGDLDSVSEADLEQLGRSGCEILSFPARKDETDLELALLLAVDRGAEELLLIGGLGGRWDQTLTNLLIGVHPALGTAALMLVDGPCEITYLLPGRPILLNGRGGDLISLVPLLGDASGITTTGLEYELRSETLTFARSRGISNSLVSNSARVRIIEGALACIHTRQDPRPISSTETPGRETETGGRP